jgi:hypothetical protein
MQASPEKWGYGESFQFQVLALCLRDPQFLAKHIDVIDHTYFETQELSTLAYLVLAHFKSRGGVPHRDTVDCIVHDYAMTYDKSGQQGLETRLRHWMNYIYERQCDEDYITSKIVKFARRQAIKHAMIKSVDWLEQEKPADDGEDVSERISREIELACLKGTGRDFGLMFQKVALTLPTVIQKSVTYRTKVPTGLPSLDADLNGGIGGGELAVIVGGPNKGKSTLLSAIGLNASYYLFDKAKKEGTKPKAVIHITCEMGDWAICLKYGAAATGMTIGDVKNGGDEYTKRMGTDIGRQAPVFIKHFPPGSTSVDAIKWYIANLIMIENIEPGMLILDYADRLKGGEDDRFRGMGKIYDSLIGIGLKFEIPVWTGSQVRRFDNNADLIDETGVAESWKKVEAADVILTMNQRTNEYKHHLMRLYAVKARDGRARNTYWMHFDPERVMARELTPEEIVEAERKHKEEGDRMKSQEGYKGAKVFQPQSNGPMRAKQPVAGTIAPPPQLPDDNFFDTLPQ